MPTPTDYTSSYTSSEMEAALDKAAAIPTVSSSDNGKVMIVENGVWSAVAAVSVYSGSSAPSGSLGSNGDIYIQTS